jgi:hypothetical protein
LKLGAKLQKTLKFWGQLGVKLKKLTAKDQSAKGAKL